MFLVSLVLLTFGVNASAFALVYMVRLIAQSKFLRAMKMKNSVSGQILINLLPIKFAQGYLEIGVCFFYG